MPTLRDQALDFLARAHRDAAFDEQVLTQLRLAGIKNPQIGAPGTLHFTNASTPRRTHPENVTPLWRARRNARRGPTARFYDARTTLAASLPCFGLLDCRWVPWCCHTEVTWIPPGIQFDANHERIPEATFYWNPFNLRIEGKLQSYLNNQSTEGQKVTTTTCHCRNGKTGSIYEPVSGSADLSTSGSYQAIAQDANEELSNLQQQINAQSGQTTRVTADFKKTGILDIIQSLWQIFTKGTIRTQVHIHVDVSYPWQGATNTQSYQLDPTVVLPVDKLNWAW